MPQYWMIVPGSVGVPGRFNCHFCYGSKRRTGTYDVFIFNPFEPKRGPKHKKTDATHNYFRRKIENNFCIRTIATTV